MAKILIVDDDVFICRMAKKAFELENHQVVIATDGKSAFKCMLSERFDLLITDLLMPEMNGWELLKTTQDHPEIPRIPVIVITGTRGLEQRVELLKSGAADILEKPFQIEELLIRSMRQLQNHYIQEGIQGFLDVYSVGDLSQNFLLTQKSGWLEVVTRDELGYVAFVDGTIKKARFGDLSGEEAFWEMNDLKCGSFKFLPNRDVSDLRTATFQHLNHLLLAAAWVDDELLRLKQPIPEPDQLLCKTDADQMLPEHETVDLFEKVLAVFDQNQHHRYQDLLKRNIASEKRVTYALRWLIEHKWLAVLASE